MTLPATPRPLPKAPFFIADVVLLLTAAGIAWVAPETLDALHLLGIVACVGLGAVLTTLPFLLDYTRLQDSALAERQAQLAALTLATTASAEQLGIAAASLQGIAEASARQLAQAEALPGQLQQRIDALDQQLGAVAAGVRVTLQEAAGTLCAAEIGRLETAAGQMREEGTLAAQRLARTAGDLTRLDEAARQGLTALETALAGLPAAAARAAESATAQVTAAGHTIFQAALEAQGSVKAAEAALTSAQATVAEQRAQAVDELKVAVEANFRAAAADFEAKAAVSAQAASEVLAAQIAAFTTTAEALVVRLETIPVAPAPAPVASPAAKKAEVQPAEVIPPAETAVETEISPVAEEVEVAAPPVEAVAEEATGADLTEAASEPVIEAAPVAEAAVEPAPEWVAEAAPQSAESAAKADEPATLEPIELAAAVDVSEKTETLPVIEVTEVTEVAEAGVQAPLGAENDLGSESVGDLEAAALAADAGAGESETVPAAAGAVEAVEALPAEPAAEAIAPTVEAEPAASSGETPQPETAVSPVVPVEVTPADVPTPAAAKAPVPHVFSIDPFEIPTNGYSLLADAMDDALTSR